MASQVTMSRKPSGTTTDYSQASSEEPPSRNTIGRHYYPMVFAKEDMERFRTQGEKIGAAACHNAARQELDNRARMAHGVAGATEPSESVTFP